MQGRSLVPVLRGRTPADWRASMYYRYYHDPGDHNTRAHYGVRTRTHKLIWNVAHPLPFPFASDLWDSATWQAARKLSPDSLYGKRTIEATLRHPQFELYDLEADPHEVHNLAGDPAQAQLLAQLQEKLQAFQKRTADPWLLKWDRE